MPPRHRCVLRPFIFDTSKVHPHPLAAPAAATRRERLLFAFTVDVRLTATVDTRRDKRPQIRPRTSSSTPSPHLTRRTRQPAVRKRPTISPPARQTYTLHIYRIKTVH
ncbi:hypothetical protein JYU34_018318 [Plutella xylostella]|uniref:Uncharacterized protein n=1 Tax=Plutella xylostella TaxID=51655 RepID=A0ABQ7PPB3_PLUXY|nr:hypothetical protein JYU34_022822 [Plutella xylostella]KAG7298658.1 hypothetical protein JYU34_018312 [Plutella xylostella]KAG7298664.1 hypothetical protein JYU34_018318 [Plutella xylostella]